MAISHNRGIQATPQKRFHADSPNSDEIDAASKRAPKGVFTEPGRLDFNIDQAERPYRFTEKRCLPGPGFEQHHSQRRRGQFQRNRRRATARTDVDSDAVRRTNEPRGRDGFQNQSIERCVGRRFEIERGEIDATIPARQQPKVFDTPVNNIRVDAELHLIESRRQLRPEV